MNRNEYKYSVKKYNFSVGLKEFPKLKVQENELIDPDRHHKYTWE